MEDEELPEWTTEMDEEILKALTSELILTPAVIAENINRSREAVSRRLNALEAGKLVKKVDRGKYRISDDAFDSVTERVELTNHKRQKAIEEDITRKESIKSELEITEKEYQEKVKKEVSKLMNEQDHTVEIEDILERAFRNVEQRHESG